MAVVVATFSAILSLGIGISNDVESSVEIRRRTTGRQRLRRYNSGCRRRSSPRPRRRGPSRARRRSSRAPNRPKTRSRRAHIRRPHAQRFSPDEASSPTVSASADAWAAASAGAQAASSNTSNRLSNLFIEFPPCQADARIARRRQSKTQGAQDPSPFAFSASSAGARRLFAREIPLRQQKRFFAVPAPPCGRRTVRGRVNPAVRASWNPGARRDRTTCSGSPNAWRRADPDRATRPVSRTPPRRPRRPKPRSIPPRPPGRPSQSPRRGSQMNYSRWSRAVIRPSDTVAHLIRDAQRFGVRPRLDGVNPPSSAPTSSGDSDAASRPDPSLAAIHRHGMRTSISDSTRISRDAVLRGIDLAVHGDLQGVRLNLQRHRAARRMQRAGRAVERRIGRQHARIGAVGRRICTGAQRVR